MNVIRVFATMLGEVTLIGLTAGILGALLAAALGLHASLPNAALTIPIAMALAAGAPTSNLDSQTVTGILDLLARLRRENQMTVIIATHDRRSPVAATA